MKRNITEGLGAFTPSVWAEIRTTVEESLRKEKGDRPPMSVSIIYAKITMFTQVTSRARWRYEWIQVVRMASSAAFPDSMFDTLVGGRTSNAVGGGEKRYAVNLAEVANTATLAFGIAVTGGVTIASATGYQIKPIPIDTIVELRLSRSRDGEISPTFSLTNPIDGECL